MECDQPVFKSSRGIKRGESLFLISHTSSEAGGVNAAANSPQPSAAAPHTLPVQGLSRRVVHVVLSRRQAEPSALQVHPSTQTPHSTSPSQPLGRVPQMWSRSHRGLGMHSSTHWVLSRLQDWPLGQAPQSRYPPPVFERRLVD